MEPHGQMAVDNAEQRIALKRAEEMIAENVALLSKLRTQRGLIEAPHRLVKIERTD
jgi:hypothetical protein